MIATEPTAGGGKNDPHPPQTGPADPPRRPERPVVPAVPSESGVGEEDPGDYENACIHMDDGKCIKPTPPQGGERT